MPRKKAPRTMTEFAILLSRRAAVARGAEAVAAHLLAADMWADCERPEEQRHHIEQATRAAMGSR